VEHGSDEDPLLVHRVQHEIGKASKQHFAGSARNEFRAQRKASHTLDRSGEREQELEPEA
jgi:hypothetical protein